jgi:flagellar basal body-associated protein FliL
VSRKIVVAVGLTAALALGGAVLGGTLAGSAPAEAAAKKESEEQSRKLPETAYVQLDPLAAPVIGGGKVRYNVMLTLSLEVGDQSHKASVTRLMPRLRDAMLMELYARPVVRDDQSGRIDLEAVKERMFGVAREVVGGGVVRDLLVVSAVRAG